jgi:hypothetical protein
MEKIEDWKRRVLDTKSSSFCGAKWLNSTVWLRAGRTASCHHNPGHQISLEELERNPSALHNTEIKKQERKMMQEGKKPLNCQYCWAYEELHPDNLGDRVWLSKHSTDEDLDRVFNTPWDQDVNPDYLEIAFDRTCQMACSYCWPGASTTWVKDLKNNGPYIRLPTDTREHFVHLGYDEDGFDYGSNNPYINAFFKWWSQGLADSVKTLKITGGEPLMSGYLWDFLGMLESGKFQANENTKISICSNLGYDPSLMQKFLDKISKIPYKFEIITSGEAYKEKGEYIRDGLIWENFVKNFELAKNSKRLEPLFIMGTVNAQAVDGFLDYLNWVKEQKVSINDKARIQFSITPVRFPTFQSLIILPKNLRVQYANEIQAYMDDHDNYKWFTEYDLVNIERFIKYVGEAEVPHKEEEKSFKNEDDYDKSHKVFDTDELARDFKSFFTQYDKRRNKNFVETFPRLADWYNSL